MYEKKAAVLKRESEKSAFLAQKISEQDRKRRQARQQREEIQAKLDVARRAQTPHTFTTTRKRTRLSARQQTGPYKIIDVMFTNIKTCASFNLPSIILGHALESPSKKLCDNKLKVPDSTSMGATVSPTFGFNHAAGQVTPARRGVKKAWQAATASSALKIK